MYHLMSSSNNLQVFAPQKPITPFHAHSTFAHELTSEVNVYETLKSKVGESGVDSMIAGLEMKLVINS